MDNRNDTQRATRHPPTPKPKRSGATPEAKVTKAIRTYLDAIGAHTLRTGAGVTSIEGRTIQIGQAGQADLTVCLPATPGGISAFCAIEIKAGKNKPSTLQARYLDKVRAVGGLAIVAYSADDVRAALVQHFGIDTVTAWEKSHV